MAIEPLHPDLLENKNRSKPKHGHPEDEDVGAKKDTASVWDLAKVFCESSAQSGLQDPLNGLVQIEDHYAGAECRLPEVDFVPDLPDAKLGSEVWYAETIGSGIGSIIPFLATELATRSIGSGKSCLALRAEADQLPLISSIAGLRNSSEYISGIAKTSLDGAIFGETFVPVGNPDKDFWQQRAKDSLCVSVTFGSQYGISHGVLNGVEKSGLGHMHFHEESALTAKSAAFRMGANLLGGSAAGLIGTETMSGLYSMGPANTNTVENSVASFAVTGLSLDAAHIIEHKLIGHKHAAVALPAEQNPPAGDRPPLDAADRSQTKLDDDKSGDA